MSNKDNLTPAEREASQAMVGALIDEAKKHGFDLMGIDYPAIAVREAVAEWLVAARKFQPVSTAA
jgi:alpha-D-ribose 1-methylphosphonate 5-triphosphate synthase subunit PhnL